MPTTNSLALPIVNGKRSRTVKFQTLGCKVNQYETQSIRERFLKHGFREVFVKKHSDICLINTCTVTAVADQKSRSIISRCINENPNALVIVTGCMVKNDSQALARIKGVDLIISKSFFADDGVSSFCGHTRAFLKIQDGCNNFCSYCKVPLVRGASRSKPLLEVVREALALAKNGFQEIVLTGICLGSYGKDLLACQSLVDVLKAMEKISGISRIRLSSIEAGDITDGLINYMASSKKLCRHLHIPIQSGDDAILNKMKRRYTRRYYLKLIKRIKDKIPGISITTDCLVGFPGETEDNFQNTLKLLNQIKPLKTHIFPYSNREGTFASKDLRQLLNPAVIRTRISKLKKAADKAATLYKTKYLGKKMDVLFEGLAKDRVGYWEGYTDNYIRVMHQSGRVLKNRLLTLRLASICQDYMVAKKG
ncbi:MAG: MiaB/RimO family radical SAM methylthiotransferase [Candidatus Omnitrophica bacterium]|nr:MiaB/RimO family radical SAM methylthiotransferase [Candidatus Omnitrophota bacterium]